jgi:hypothetical protein
MFENKKGVMRMKAALHHVIMVVYDGIENSVFESQVLAPLFAELEANKELEVTLISFERTVPAAALLNKKIPPHDRFHLVIAQRFPFLGTLSLRSALWQLIKILKMVGGAELRARGPLAGWLVLRAAEKFVNPQIVELGLVPPVLIQARGLAAQELRYARERSKHGVMRRVKDWLVQKLLHRLESAVYGYRGVIVQAGKLTIESVSTALREYLVTTFHADAKIITIATKDITPRLPSADVKQWRLAKRKLLGIDPRARVYVYSGSFKPWQCAQETVAEASKILTTQSDAFFLVLSLDVVPFEKALHVAGVDKARWRVLSVSSSELTQFLAAADVGFLLREADVINWVSRPTKMLEYQAVGLKIIHNRTVGCLVVS